MHVAPPLDHHRTRWGELYGLYAEFYRVAQTEAMRDTVWGWITDPTHEVAALLAVDATDVPVGLAHFRPFARPLSASIGGYLDDLFVDPAARGSGAAQALIAAVAEYGRRRGWSAIQWKTAEDNARARNVYDRLATRTGWVTYDIAL